jgi:hypothetical protein
MTERTPGSPTAAVGTILARAFWYLGRSPARGRGRGARDSPPLLAAYDYAVSTPPQTTRFMVPILVRSL